MQTTIDGINPKPPVRAALWLCRLSVLGTICLVLVTAHAAEPSKTATPPRQSREGNRPSKGKSSTSLSDLFHLLRQDMMPVATTVGKNHELVKHSFEPILEQIRDSVVPVFVDEEQVALATVVAPSGWLLTKFSELTGPAECRCTDGKSYVARIVSRDTDQDVALLKIEAEHLVPVPLSDADNVPVGSWLASPAVGASEPLVVGMVSVAARAIPRHEAILGIQLAEATDGVKVQSVFPHSAADEAGIQPDDVVVSLDDTKVSSSDAIIRTIRQMRAGDVVRVQVRRGTEMIDLRPRLGRMSDLLTQEHVAYKEVVGKLSTRRSDFPRVIQHDTILEPNECGGPIVDTTGRVVGMNIARADRTASYALTARTMRQLLARHLPGTQSPGAQPPSTQSPPARRPAARAP